MICLFKNYLACNELFEFVAITPEGYTVKCRNMTCFRPQGLGRHQYLVKVNRCSCRHGCYIF